MGDIVDRIEDNMKDTPSRRIGDINILYLAGVVEDLKKKMEDGLSSKIDKIWQKLSALPCEAHIEIIRKNAEIHNLKIDNLKREINNAPKSNRTAINWLWGAYLSTIGFLVWLLYKL